MRPPRVPALAPLLALALAAPASAGYLDVTVQPTTISSLAGDRFYSGVGSFAVNSFEGDGGGQETEIDGRFLGPVELTAGGVIEAAVAATFSTRLQSFYGVAPAATGTLSIALDVAGSSPSVVGGSIDFAVVSAVSEPSSLAVLGLGTLSLLGAARRRGAGLAATARR